MSRSRKDPEELFWRHVDKTGDGGHWLWTGALHPAGYGIWRQYSPAVTQTAHRWSWGFTRGPIPSGLVIDHICQIRACVNPDHLQVVTQRHNMELIGIRKREQTTCKRGHLWTDDNTYVSPKGTRICKTCQKLVPSHYTRNRLPQPIQLPLPYLEVA